MEIRLLKSVFFLIMDNYCGLVNIQNLNIQLFCLQNWLPASSLYVTLHSAQEKTSLPQSLFFDPSRRRFGSQVILREDASDHRNILREDARITVTCNKACLQAIAYSRRLGLYPRICVYFSKTGLI